MSTPKIHVPSYADTPRAWDLPVVLPRNAGDPMSPWMKRAACLGRGDIFTNEHSHTAVTKARKVCRTECPVADWCLADALADKGAQGIRAGFHFTMGGLPKKSRDMIMKMYRRTTRAIPSVH